MTNALEVGGECWTGNFIPIYCPPPHLTGIELIKEKKWALQRVLLSFAAPTCTVCQEWFYADLPFPPSGTNFLIYASKKAGFTWPQKEKPVLCFAFPPTHLCSCRFCAGIRHAKLVFWLLSLSFKTRGILRAFADLFLS